MNESRSAVGGRQSSIGSQPSAVDSQPSAVGVKRAYAPPELVEYGSVARLTATKSGAPTDSGMPMTTCL